MGRVVLVLLTVPLAVFVVATLCLDRYESEWQSVLAKQYPNATATQRHGFQLRHLCQLIDVSDEAVCRDLRYIDLMRDGSIIAALAGLGLTFGIRWSGRAAQQDRQKLLKVFRPGLHVTIWALIGLVVLQAAIVMAKPQSSWPRSTLVITYFLATFILG